MKIGMLWFDNNPRMDIHQKIAKARAYYQEKYERVANMVFVHPSMVPTQDDITTPEYVVRPNRSIMPNHFWIGVDSDIVLPQVVEIVDKPAEAIPVINKILNRARRQEWSPLED
jgi:hypothetical protein